jgi:hypothetical protein
LRRRRLGPIRSSLCGETLTKVVSERPDHAKPGITEDLHQHVTPGMQRDAAASLAAAVEE